MAKGKELTCNKCGHKWRPRTDKEPDECPKCKSRKWRKVKPNV